MLYQDIKVFLCPCGKCTIKAKLDQDLRLIPNQKPWQLRSMTVGRVVIGLIPHRRVFQQIYSAPSSIKSELGTEEKSGEVKVVKINACKWPFRFPLPPLNDEDLGQHELRGPQYHIMYPISSLSPPITSHVSDFFLRPPVPVISHYVSNFFLRPPVISHYVSDVFSRPPVPVISHYVLIAFTWTV